jgi:hypothetical protein
MTKLCFKHKIIVKVFIEDSKMQFTIINLKNLQRNEGNNNTSLNKFTSLMDSAIKSLQEINRYLAKLPQLSIGLAGKTLAAYQKDLKESIGTLNATLFHIEAEKYRSDLTKIKMYHWYLEQNKSLALEQTWQRFIQACKTSSKREVLILKADWKKHGKYSHYSSEALYEIAVTVIPTVKNYLSLLRSEYKVYGNLLSAYEKIEIEGYMKILKFEIKKMENELVEAMLARLKIASKSGDIQSDDVTFELVDNLKKLSVLKESYILPKCQSFGLNATTFDFFNHYIAQKGSAEQRIILDRFVWHRVDDDHVVIKKLHTCIVVPKILEIFIDYRNLFEKFLGITKRNEQFLHERYALIAQLRFHINPAKHFTSLFSFYNAAWQKLNILSKQVASDYVLCECEKPKHFLTRFFLKNRHGFLSGWQTYLILQQEKIVYSMLAYAKYIGKQLRTRLYFGLDLEALTSKRFQQELLCFNEDILQAIKHTGLKSEELSDYQDFLSYLKRAINLPKELKEAKNTNTVEPTEALSDDMLENNNHEEGEIAEPDETVIKSVEEEDTGLFRSISENEALNELKNILEQVLPKRGYFIFPDDSFILDKLSSGFLDASPKRIDTSDEIRSLFEQLFKAYLNTWINSLEEHKQMLSCQVSTIESFISSIAPIHIKERVAQVIQIRDQEAWFVFQAKCFGLLASFDPDETRNQDYINKLEALCFGEIAINKLPPTDSCPSK